MVVLKRLHMTLTKVVKARFARGSGPSPPAILAVRRCAGLVVACLLVLESLVFISPARAGEFDEYAVKAAYLYNFAKFVEWPAEAFTSTATPLAICIVGENLFGGALENLSGKVVERHPVEIKYLPTAAGFERCHIVFMSRTEQGRFKALLAKLAHLPILTVSDITNFTQEGGMIGLVEAEQRIRFNINLSVARQANLNLSSQLLKLAITVN
jgi:hypothetical protein